MENRRLGRDVRQRPPVRMFQFLFGPTAPGARQRRETVATIAPRLAAVIPAPVWEEGRSLLSRNRRRINFIAKRYRTSGTDYIVKFDPRSIKEAKDSILWFSDWEQRTRADIQILQDLNLIRDNQRVMDYGCGVGRLAKALLERYGLYILAVDRSQQMRNLARQYIPPGLFEQGKVDLWSDQELIERLPAMAEKIDLILCFEVIQHIPEPILDELLPQLVKALAPDGEVFVFGNLRLDVDAQGAVQETTVKSVLNKHFEILRHDRWTEVPVGNRSYRFLIPKHSLVCRPRRDCSPREY